MMILCAPGEVTAPSETPEVSAKVFSPMDSSATVDGGGMPCAKVACTHWQLSPAIL